MSSPLPYSATNRAAYLLEAAAQILPFGENIPAIALHLRALAVDLLA